MSVPMLISRWSTLIEGLQASPKEFYASVEAAVESRGLPETRRSRVTFRERGMFSAGREYLRVQSGGFVFDICGAPYGNGFFVSWWMGELAGCAGALFRMPVFGSFFSLFLGGDTYYKADTEAMFQASVRQAVNEVVDQITKAKGLRALSEDEKKPILSRLVR